ncbi:MAG: sugar phosphate nucleotidyltransferase [Methanobacteriota archaeon]
MQALVIAGGLGTRLRPITYSRPKALVPLLNRPQILYLLDGLPEAVDEVLIAVNYRYEEVRDFFKGRDLGRTVTVIHEEEPLGTGGAIKNVEDRIDGPFVTMNGDVIDALNLSDVVAFHEARRAAATVVVTPVEDPTAFGVVAFEGDRITRFVEKPKADEAPSNLVNAGRYVFESTIFDMIPGGRPVSLEREVFPALIPKGLAMFRYDGMWSDAGTLASYLAAQRLLLAAGRGGVAPDADIARARLVPHVLISGGGSVEGHLGPNVVVGHGCRIARATVDHAAFFDGVSVDDKAHVSHAILGERVAVGEGAVVRDSIVGDGTQVPPHAKVVDARVSA